MRRHAVLITLLASQLAVAALGAFFHLAARVSVLAAFEEFGTTIPPLTRIALSGWLMPGAVGTALLLALIALVAPLRRSQRHGLLGVGLVLSSIVLVFVVWATFAPLFQPA